MPDFTDSLRCLRDIPSHLGQVRPSRRRYREWFVQALEKETPPLHRRAGFEVAGWDGARWILEGIFENGAEASSQAKLVLARRLGVRITQEVFSDTDGVFKSRVIMTEYRDPNMRPDRKRPAEAAAIPTRVLGKRILAGADALLFVAISSLVISITAMLFSIMR